MKKTSKIKYSTYVKGRIGWQGLRSDEFTIVGPYLVTGTNFKNGAIDWEKCYHVSDERYNEAPEIQLQENDLLITKDGTIGKIALVINKPEKAILNSGVFVTRPLKSNYTSKYMYWVLNSKLFTEYVDLSQIGSTIKHLYQETFENFEYPLPNINVQTAIVNYLDNKIVKVDTIINNKQKLIELLQEKRQVIIDEAVTKGLDPNVPMKDSGIEWLGTVPANWNLTKIKFITKIKGRIGFRGYTTEDIVNYREGALTLGAKHINKKYQIDLSDPEFISWEKYYESPEIMLKIMQRGSTVGKVAIINKDIGEATINPSLMVLKETTCVPQYLYYFLSSSYIRDNIKVVTSVTAIPMISQEQINNFVIVIPSLEEQLEIADYLKGQSKQIETIIDKINIQIKKIQEYRQSLISEAVTGKIDVAVMERRHNNDH